MAAVRARPADDAEAEVIDRELELAIAWAAGLVEGEGWIGLIHEGGRDYPTVAVDTTDYDVARRLNEILGGSLSGPLSNSYPKSYMRPEQRKERWRWSCAGERARRVLDLLGPYLCERRSARALEVLEQATPPKRAVNPLSKKKGRGSIDILILVDP